MMRILLSKNKNLIYLFLLLFFLLVLIVGYFLWHNLSKNHKIEDDIPVATLSEMVFPNSGIFEDVVINDPDLGGIRFAFVKVAIKEIVKSSPKKMIISFPKYISEDNTYRNVDVIVRYGSIDAFIPAISKITTYNADTLLVTSRQDILNHFDPNIPRVENILAPGRSIYLLLPKYYPDLVTLEKTNCDRIDCQYFQLANYYNSLDYNDLVSNSFNDNDIIIPKLMFIVINENP